MQRETLDHLVRLWVRFADTTHRMQQVQHAMGFQQLSEDTDGRPAADRSELPFQSATFNPAVVHPWRGYWKVEFPSAFSFGQDSAPS